MHKTDIVKKHIKHFCGFISQCVYIVFRLKLTLMVKISDVCSTPLEGLKGKPVHGFNDSLLFNPQNLLTVKDKSDRIQIISLNPVPDRVSAMVTNGAVSSVK